MFHTLVCWLTALTFGLSGCASKVALPEEAMRIGTIPTEGLLAPPSIVPDDQRIGLVGFYFSDEERAELELSRDRAVAAHTRPVNMNMSGVGGNEALVCVLLLPLCLVFVILPAAVTASAFEHGRASSKVPSVPSERELARMGEKIQERFAATALAERTSRNLQNPGTGADGKLPLLLIRPESASFDFGTSSGRALSINLVAQAEPSAGLEWPMTQHRYSIRGDLRELDRDLEFAQEALAQSLVETYLPARSAVAAAKAAPRVGDLFTYHVTDRSKWSARTFKVTTRVTAVGEDGIEEELNSPDTEGREWLKTAGRDIASVRIARFRAAHHDRLTCLAGRICASEEISRRSQRVRVPAGLFDAQVTTLKQSWDLGQGFRSSRSLTVWHSSENRLLKAEASDSFFGENTSGKYEIELVSY
ncbi:MAG TPA: hypothetical protein VL199_10450, partial [Burkholderiales bacterium]|nr:hypothetical protein [Burkholderiales bacterium]